MELPGEFSQISAFDKLLIIRMIRPDKVVPAVCISAVAGLHPASKQRNKGLTFQLESYVP